MHKISLFTKYIKLIKIYKSQLKFYLVVIKRYNFLLRDRIFILYDDNHIDKKNNYFQINLYQNLSQIIVFALDSYILGFIKFKILKLSV